MTNLARQARHDESSPEHRSDYQLHVVTCRQLAALAETHPILVRRGKPIGPASYVNAPAYAWDYPCFFYLTDAEENVAAYTRAFPDELLAHEKRYPWAWTGDLFTEPEFRGRGVATELQRRSTAWLHEHGIGRGSVFSVDTTLHIYEKIGATVVGFASRYLMLKTARPLLAAHLPAPWARPLGRLTQPLVSAAARAKWTWTRTMHGGRRPQLRCLEWTSEMLSDIESPQVKSLLPFRFDERREQLIWKLRLANANRANRCSFYWLVDVHDVPQAFFVTRRKQQKTPLAGKYQDFELFTLMHYGLFRNDPALYAAIADWTLKLFWQSSAEVLEVITNQSPLAAELKRVGLLPVGRGMSFTIGLPTSWGELPSWNQLESWPLTHFRGDAFSF